MESIVTTIDHCARCGQTHADIEFDVFVNPPPAYTHFALCPTNDQPILLKVVQTD